METVSIEQRDYGNDFKQMVVTWTNPSRMYGMLTRVHVRITTEPLLNVTAVPNNTLLVEAEQNAVSFKNPSPELS